MIENFDAIIAFHRKKKLLELRGHLLWSLKGFWIDFEAAMEDDRINRTYETAIDRNFEQRRDVEDVEESVDDGCVFCEVETHVAFRMMLDEAEIGEAESVQQLLQCEVGALVDLNYAGDRGLMLSRL